jgi:TonB family protein
VEEPVPLELPRYRYPPEARGTGLRPGVRLALLVDERGRVIDARVREGASPDLGFAETALSVAQRIPFQPATRDQVPGKMWTELILEFVE